MAADPNTASSTASAYATWLPLVTLVIGFVTATLTDFFKHRLQWTRERELKKEDRLEARALQQIDFQRTTLIELQEVSSTLARCTGAMNHIDIVEFNKTGQWQKNQYSEEWSGKENDSRRRHIELTVRVDDQNVRELSNQFRDGCHKILYCTTPKEAEAALRSSIDTFETLNEAIGLKLRQLRLDELPHHRVVLKS